MFSWYLYLEKINILYSRTDFLGYKNYILKIWNYSNLFGSIKLFICLRKLKLNLNYFQN